MDALAICLGTPETDQHLNPLVNAIRKNTSLQDFQFVEPAGRIVEPTVGSMLAIKMRTDENRRNAWLALAQGGMRMLLQADDTLGATAGRIAQDHIGRDAARLGLVNKDALHYAQAYRSRNAGSPD